MRDSTAINIDLKGRTPPTFVAVEGPIGVGKTTLAKKLAASSTTRPCSKMPRKTPFSRSSTVTASRLPWPPSYSFYSSAHRKFRTCARQISSSRYG